MEPGKRFVRVTLYPFFEFMELLKLKSNEGKLFVSDLLVLENFGDKRADRVKLSNYRGVDLLMFRNFILEVCAEGGKAS